MNINPIDKQANKIYLFALNDEFKITQPLMDLGYILKSSFEQKAAKEQFRSEEGCVRAVDFSYDTRTTAILMRRDKKLIDFLTQEVKGKLFIQYHYRGICNGKHQEIFSVVKVTPQTKIDTPGAAKSFPYEATHIAMNVSIEITVNNILAINSLLNIQIFSKKKIIIPAGSEFVIIKTESL